MIGVGHGSGMSGWRRTLHCASSPMQRDVQVGNGDQVWGRFRGSGGEWGSGMAEDRVFGGEFQVLADAYAAWVVRRARQQVTGRRREYRVWGAGQAGSEEGGGRSGDGESGRESER
jgi:hypothetical protein